MRTIAVINQKGGCGKTTTAINLGAALGRAGLRTLLVDLDSQGHCAAGLGVPESGIDLDSSDLLLSGGARGLDLGRLLWRASRNLDLVPSRIKLAGLEAPGSSFGRQEQRERALARALGAMADRFDVCLVDCPPSIGLLTFNALVAADLVLVPVETGYFSLQGAARQLSTVRSLGRRLQTEIRCAVVPTLHEPGLAVAEDLLGEMRRRFGRRVLPVTIRRDAALREAASFGRPVCEHAPSSDGSRDYAALASVLMESEHLLAGPADEDWTAIEAASETPIARPRAPGPSPAVSPSCAPVQFVSAETLVGQVSVHAPLGDIVVTFAGAELHQGLAKRIVDAPAQGASRAEDLARRASQLRPSEAGPAVLPARPTPPGRRAFGAHAGANGVMFTQPGALGKRVEVAGDFSGWRPIAMSMHPESQTHELCLALRAGRHEYRLIVDGHWIADPYNTEWILNEFGEPHSIVEIAGDTDQTPDSELGCGAD
ncbi:MAG TPA: AAA family ATPase [Phycisphaerales bacterium]|nr:AAA family ATPase [Phycisphaerales bacterium]